MENHNPTHRIVYGISQVPITNDVYDVLKKFDTDNDGNIDLISGNDIIGVENEYFSDDKKREYRLGIVIGTLVENVEKVDVKDSQAKGLIRFFQVNEDVTTAYNAIYDNKTGWKLKADKKGEKISFEKNYWNSNVEPLLSKGVFHNLGHPLAAETYDMFWELKGENPPNNSVYAEYGTGFSSHFGQGEICGLEYNINEMPPDFSKNVESLVAMYNDVKAFFGDSTSIGCDKGCSWSGYKLDYSGRFFFLTINEKGKTLEDLHYCEEKVDVSVNEPANEPFKGVRGVLGSITKKTKKILELFYKTAATMAPMAGAAVSPGDSIPKR